MGQPCPKAEPWPGAERWDQAVHGVLPGRLPHLLVRVHVLVQVGDVHVWLPDELELVVAELDEHARGLGHGGQVRDRALARDNMP